VNYSFNIIVLQCVRILFSATLVQSILRASCLLLPWNECLQFRSFRVAASHATK